MTKEDMTKKYMEFQVLSQQINKFQQQINLITQQVGELKSLSNNVSEISKVKQDSEMYTNLGVGVHVKSLVKDLNFKSAYIKIKNLQEKSIDFSCFFMVNFHTLLLFVAGKMPALPGTNVLVCKSYV